MKRTTQIPIADIIIDASFQTRANGTVDEVVTDYARDLSVLPPVQAARVAGKLYLTDGFHRIKAHLAREITKIECSIVDCASIVDARKLALQANLTHGLRRSNADKRRITIMALGIYDDSMSLRQLGDLIGVSHEFVNTIKGELLETAKQKLDKRDAKKAPLKKNLPEPLPHTSPVDDVEINEEGDEIETLILDDPSDKTAADMIRQFLTGEVALKTLEYIYSVPGGPELAITIQRKVWEAPK